MYSTSNSQETITIISATDNHKFEITTPKVFKNKIEQCVRNFRSVIEFKHSTQKKKGKNQRNWFEKRKNRNSISNRISRKRSETLELELIVMRCENMRELNYLLCLFFFSNQTNLIEIGFGMKQSRRATSNNFLLPAIKIRRLKMIRSILAVENEQP